MGHAWGMGPPSSPKAAPRTAHIFPLPLLIFLNGFIPIASVLRGGRTVRRVRCSYGVRTVSRTVSRTVFGPCVARRTVRTPVRRTVFGFFIFKYFIPLAGKYFIPDLNWLKWRQLRKCRVRCRTSYGFDVFFSGFYIQIQGPCMDTEFPPRASRGIAQARQLAGANTYRQSYF